MWRKAVKLLSIWSLVCLIVAATCPLAAAGELELFTEIMPEEVYPNVDPSAVYSDGSTYKFPIGPGGYYSNESELQGEYPSDCGSPEDYDRYIMKVTATAKINIVVIDCCIMGDTICLAKNAARKKCALSPEVVVHTQTFNPGIYAFYVLYHGETTCLFPGGYEIIVDAQ